MLTTSKYTLSYEKKMNSDLKTRGGHLKKKIMSDIVRDTLMSVPLQKHRREIFLPHIKTYKLLRF